MLKLTISFRKSSQKVDLAEMHKFSKRENSYTLPAAKAQAHDTFFLGEMEESTVMHRMPVSI
jgi:hypothetical protein